MRDSEMKKIRICGILYIQGGGRFDATFDDEIDGQNW